VNERGASLALEAAAGGDHGKLPLLTGWLAERDGIAGRYLPSDLEEAASRAAEDDTGLEELVKNLKSPPDSVLVTFFPGTEAREVIEVEGAAIGPAEKLADYAPAGAPSEWPDGTPVLAILTHHPAQGRLGAVKTAAWLQTILGAVLIASYAKTGQLLPLGRSPAVGSALYYSGSACPGEQVERAALAAPGPPAATELAELEASEESLALIADAASKQPSDLAARRLTLAARWLQLAASAITTADAFVSLGIALETIAGDSEKSSVQERVTQRSAIYVVNSLPPEERPDAYEEQTAAAKRFYELRSRASHGQYAERDGEREQDETARAEFHRFVLNVALGFRDHSRQRQMRDTADLERWWKRAKLEGLFS
jgi:hypothetical protein